MLGDEFTPDGCRLWEMQTGEKMDKDRFRRDLGNVIEHYRDVARRIGAPLLGFRRPREQTWVSRSLGLGAAKVRREVSRFAWA